MNYNEKYIHNINNFVHKIIQAGSIKIERQADRQTDI